MGNSQTRRRKNTCSKTVTIESKGSKRQFSERGRKTREKTEEKERRKWERSKKNSVQLRKDNYDWIERKVEYFACFSRRASDDD